MTQLDSTTEILSDLDKARITYTGAMLFSGKMTSFEYQSEYQNKRCSFVEFNTDLENAIELLDLSLTFVHHSLTHIVLEKIYGTN